MTSSVWGGSNLQLQPRLLEFWGRRAEEGKERGSLIPAKAWLFSKGCKIYRARKKGLEKKKELDSSLNMRASFGRKKEPYSSMFLILLINLVLNKNFYMLMFSYVWDWSSLWSFKKSKEEPCLQQMFVERQQHGCEAMCCFGWHAAQHSHLKSHLNCCLHKAAMVSPCPGREHVSQVRMCFWAAIPHRNFAVFLPAKGHLGCTMPWDWGLCSCTGVECWPWVLRFISKWGVEVGGTKESYQWSKD